MSRKINIRPTTSVYATYKNIKYDPWTAIAEFVDNATQSYYDNIDKLKKTKYWNGLEIEIIYEKNSDTGDRLIIRDNAYGMDFNDFQRAIVLDSPPKKKTRSEFGMGLKTAACWFGTNWSVETTELGSPDKYIANIDVEALRKYKNEEIDVEEIPCSPKEHGTIITIWNLNRTISGRQVGKTKEQLQGMYRTDIRSGEIIIRYNTEALHYEEPTILKEALPDGSKKTWKKSVDFEVPYKDSSLRVTGFIALRETASTSSAGFALLRKGRVIVGGYENAYRPEEIFEKSNSFVYQRLFGELALDDWPVTQTKDAFDWHSGLEDELIMKLSSECEEYKKKAKEYRVGRKTSIDVGIQDLVKVFSQAGIIENVKVESIDEAVSQTTVNPSQSPDPSSSSEASGIVVTQSATNDIIIEGGSGKKIAFETNGSKYIFNLILCKNNPQKHWLSISPHNGEFNIEWNIRHPFFKPHIDEPAFLSIMEQFIFALALSEIETIKISVGGQVEPSAVRMRMNDILTDIAKGGQKL